MDTGHISENYRGILKDFIKKDLPKDALLAVIDAIPSCPLDCASTSANSPRSIITNNIYQKEGIDIIVNNVHRNEQVNILALSKGLQTVLCSNLSRGSCYALWPMVGDSDKFSLSPEGEIYQAQIRREMDGRLDRFPRTFAAKVYSRTKLIHNSVLFWEDMKSAGLFKYWDPEEGPYKYYQEADNQDLQMLQVYKVEHDLNPYITPNASFRNAPVWKGGLMQCKGVPILSNQALEDQLGKFNEILVKHGNLPARKE